MELNQAQIDELRVQQRREKGKKPYVRVTAILMLAQGLSAEEIGQYLGLSATTVRTLRQRYQEKGIKAILHDNYVAYQGKLRAEQQAQIKQHLSEHLYLSTQPIQAYILEEFGIYLTYSALAKLLRRLGFVYKKTHLRPGRASATKQAEFLSQHADLLHPDGPPAGVEVYFNDAVHPHYNTRPDYGWILKGRDYEICSTGEGKRLNLHGALNAHHPSEVIIHEYDTIDAAAVLATWQEQLLRHPGQIIYNICDNARYYHSKALKAWLSENPRIKVIYLPSYSPNLNLIERLWRLMRRESINTFYYASYAKFRSSILSFFDNLQHLEAKLESLLTLRFRVVST